MDQTTIAFILIFLLFAVPAWLVWRNYQQEKKRKEAILEYMEEWGAEICATLINKRIAVDMTQKMVVLAWGEPNYADQKELSKKGEKIRWVYGTPRRDAKYVWFTNHQVTKIKT